MNKHYIRLDGIFIVKSFSDAFETPLETDIFIEDGGRHYNLDLLRKDGLSKYKYINNEMVETIDNDFVDELLEIEKEILRERRNSECFEYWNRQWVIEPEPNKPHQVTQEQFNEMELWYEAWLNVTETMIIPTKPEWLAI